MVFRLHVFSFPIVLPVKSGINLSNSDFSAYEFSVDGKRRELTLKSLISFRSCFS